MAIIDNFAVEELRRIVLESQSYREVLRKLGYNTATGSNHKTLKKRLELYNIDTSHFLSCNKVTVVRNESNVFCENSTATQSILRTWFIKGEYIEYKCSICGVGNVWNDRPLVLQLDHINGNNSDNRLENLRWLCPNCHSQTDTFCGRHTKRKHVQYSESDKIYNYCIDCGRRISSSATRCKDCYNKSRRQQIWPAPEQLRQELFDTNFVQVGKKYGVDSNTIRNGVKHMECQQNQKITSHKFMAYVGSIPTIPATY